MIDCVVVVDGFSPDVLSNRTRWRRRPMSSCQRDHKSRPLQVWTTNSPLLTRFPFMCWIWPLTVTFLLYFLWLTKLWNMIYLQCQWLCFHPKAVRRENMIYLFVKGLKMQFLNIQTLFLKWLFHMRRTIRQKCSLKQQQKTELLKYESEFTLSTWK